MSSSAVNSINSSRNSAQRQFTVQYTGHLGEFETVRRIGCLFSVRLDLSHNPQGTQGEWVGVQLTGSEENILKARKYILALCMPELQLEVTTGGPMFTDILSRDSSGRICDELEYNYQAAISFLPNRNGVLVKGAPSDVYQIAQRLSMESSTARVENPYGLSTRGVDFRTSEPPLNHSHQSYATPQDLDKQLTDALQQGVDTFPDHLKKALLEKLQNNERYRQHSQPPPPPQIVPPSSGLMSRAADKTREQKVEKFIKLGYSREKIEAALTSLGENAPDDDILARLLKTNVSTPNHRHSRTLNISRQRSSYGEPIVPSIVQPPTPVDPSQLRHIVIDGSNVAMRHGNGRVFSCKGIQLAVDYFRQRGHENVTVFVPDWRKETSRPETPITDQEILYSLERENVLKFTPSRRVQGKRIVCYDDRFIVRLAHEEGGVILSNDQFRDLIEEKPVWRDVIEQRLIQFTFVNDLLMIPDDPLGKYGPTLDKILLKDSAEVLAASRRSGSDKVSNLKICPYLETGCTFGRKCKFYHPDRDQPHGGTGSKTPNSSRSATPSPSPEKSLGYKPLHEDPARQHPSNYGYPDDLVSFSSEQLHPSSATSPSQPGIDISSVSDHLSRVSISPHKQPPQEPLSYQGPYSQPAVPKPQYISLPPTQPQDYSRSTPALTSESLPSTPMDDRRPHMHTFPLATLNQPGSNARQKNVTEDFTQQRKHATAFSPAETPDQLHRMPPPPIDHQQYNMPPNMLLPRGLDPRSSSYTTNTLPQGFSQPYHHHPSQAGPNYPQRPPTHHDMVASHRPSPMLQQQPSKSVSYPYFEPPQHPQSSRWSADFSSNSMYQGDGGYHHHQHQQPHRQHHHQRAYTGGDRTSSGAAYGMHHPPLPQSQSSSALSHSHSYSQLPSHSSQYSSRLPGVSEASYYSGHDAMRFTPILQSEPEIDMNLFHQFTLVFPGCEERIKRVMRAYPNVTDCAEFEQLLKMGN